MENNNLRQEIKKLKAFQTVQAGMEYSREKTQTLEKLFRDLNAELEGKPGGLTPDLSNLWPNAS